MKKSSVLFASLMAGALSAFMSFGEVSVDDQLPAGNIVFDRIEGNAVYVHQDLRDTTDAWFYWAMRVTGAAGKTLTFNFTTSDAVGVRGPVVTADGGKTYSYPASSGATRRQFTYTFGADENETWFYEAIPYTPDDWAAFLAQHEAKRGTWFETGVLCPSSKKSAQVPKARFGSISGTPKYKLLISSRHHCSETVATYVLEGIAAAFLKDDDLGAWLRANVLCEAVPFVDYDGAVAGDQGKNRSPHDHNRDYTDFIYTETTALAVLAESMAPDVWFDIHCPWLHGGCNEYLYTPLKDPKLPYVQPANETRFSQLLAANISTDGIPYSASNDIAFGTSWNTDANYSQGASSIIWGLQNLSSVKLCRTFEVPFANAGGTTVTTARLRVLGNDIAKSLKAFLTEQESAPAASEPKGGEAKDSTSGYTRLDYVQATHSQYVDTGYQPNAKTTVYLKFAADDYQASHADGTSTSLADRSNVYVLACYDDRCQFGYGNTWFLGFGKDDGSTLAYDNKGGASKDTNVHEMGLTNGVFYIDGAKRFESPRKNFTKGSDQATLSVFALHQKDTSQNIYKFWCAAKVYSLIITEDGETKLYFVPAKDGSNNVGFYDCVSGTFFKSDTTTQLIAGPESAITDFPVIDTPDTPEEPETPEEPDTSKILVYDGFNASAYTISAKGTGTLSSYPKNYDSSMIGFNASLWEMTGSQPKVWGYGLNFPSTFAAKGITAGGEWSIGPNGGGNNTQNRNTSRKLAADVLKLSSGSLYFRLLMHLDKTAVATMKSADTLIEAKGADANFWGVGFAPNTGISYDLLTATSGAFGFFFRKNSKGAVSVIFRGKGADGTVLEKELCAVPAANTGLRDDNTYIAYAQIDINAGSNGGDVIYAGAQNITTYSATTAGEELGISIGVLDLFSDTVYPKSVVFDGCYQTNGKVYFDEIGVATEATDLIDVVFSGALKLVDGAVTGMTGAYKASATVARSAATDAGAIAFDGETAFLYPVGAVAQDAAFEQAISLPTPADDKTYNLGVYATNATGGETNFFATAYNGVLTLEKVRDADEYKCAAGEVRVSRAHADPYPLTVNYTFTSTTSGAAEGTTWEAPVAVTIPAGETSATICLKPIIDSTILEDIDVTLQVAAGNYPSVTETVDLTLKNMVTPDGYNTWVAAADGKASVASNWSNGVPQEGDKILFDGNFSNASCEWDADTENGPSATVDSLTVGEGYSGKITILTTFPEVEDSSFHVFTVTHDATVSCGTITHGAHTASHAVDYYRLRMDVGGNLTVGDDTVISASSKGSFKARTNLGSTYGGSYNSQRAWGSLTEPYGVGSSGNAGNEICWAGGAIWLEVAGATTLNGKLVANAVSAAVSGDTFTGSGGAIYLKSATLSGSGTIAANGNAMGRSSNTKSSAGGRVSVLLTGGELTDFPAENITAYASYASYANVGGAGTVLVRTPQKPNGILYLRDQEKKYDTYGYRPNVGQLTDIPKDEKWKLDGIVFGRNSILRVRADNELELVNGLESVSATTTERENGIYLDNGATLKLPAQATYTISSPWVFQANGGFVLNGNLALVNGGAIGTHNLYITDTNSTPRCEMRVTGNMSVDSDSFIWAQGGGYFGNNIKTVPFGASARGAHGGQNAADASVISYDSFFNPRYPGGFGDNGNYFPVGGGAVILTVDGDLELNGRATASPKIANVKGRPGAAGTINLTVGSLSGTGSIEANGQKWDSQYDQGNYKGASGGGRVAVKLTKNGAVFSDHWQSHVFAKGSSTTWSGTNPLKTTYASSAGSVYLQDATQGECCGSIIVANDDDTSNTNAYTVLPTRAYGGENDVFDKASLRVSACAQIRLTETIKMENLTLDKNCKLDLNGQTLTVKAARLNGKRLKLGTHTAGSTAVAGFVTDSSEGAAGKLVVTGHGLVLMIR